MQPTTWIGVDIAKADFVAAQRTEQGFEVQTFPMTHPGFEAFRDWLPEADGLAIVFEATGPDGLRLAHWLDGLQETIPYACINPRQLRNFAKASPERSKTDPIDAALLVHFAETFPLAWNEPSPSPPSAYGPSGAITWSSRTSWITPAIVRRKPQPTPGYPPSSPRDSRPSWTASSTNSIPSNVEPKNWRLRRALYMAALVAAMRKLLHLVYGVLKHQQPFNPDYETLT